MMIFCTFFFPLDCCMVNIGNCLSYLFGFQSHGFGKWMLFQVLGAVWYLFAVDRKYMCFQTACLSSVQRCRPASLYCGEESMGNNDFLNSICSVENAFDFGIYFDAIQSKIVQSRDFSQRLFYCFWWGLRNMRFVLLKALLLLSFIKSQYSLNDLHDPPCICVWNCWHLYLEVFFLMLLWVASGKCSWIYLLQG